jgi:hypothetical protein
MQQVTGISQPISERYKNDSDWFPKAVTGNGYEINTICGTSRARNLTSQYMLLGGEV